MKVLLAVDGSEISLRATKKMIEMADWYKDRPELHLVTINMPLPYSSRASHVLGPAWLEGYYKDSAEEVLKPSRDALDAAGITYQTHTSVGNVAHEINRIAEAQKCDMIVVGTHGRGGVADFALGSVARMIVHGARVPVVLVR